MPFSPPLPTPITPSAVPPLCVEVYALKPPPMPPSHRVLGFASVAMGVGLSAWIAWTNNLWGPLVLVAYLPALLGTGACLLILASGSRAPSDSGDDSGPGPSVGKPPSSWAWVFVFFVLPAVAVCLALAVGRF